MDLDAACQIRRLLLRVLAHAITLEAATDELLELLDARQMQGYDAGKRAGRDTPTVLGGVLRLVTLCQRQGDQHG